VTSSQRENLSLLWCYALFPPFSKSARSIGTSATIYAVTQYSISKTGILILKTVPKHSSRESFVCTWIKIWLCLLLMLPRRGQKAEYNRHAINWIRKECYVMNDLLVQYVQISLPDGRTRHYAFHRKNNERHHPFRLLFITSHTSALQIIAASVQLLKSLMPCVFQNAIRRNIRRCLFICRAAATVKSSR
jgi:hypothetical protein